MKIYKYCDVTVGSGKLTIRWTDKAEHELMLSELGKVYSFKIEDSRSYGTVLNKFDKEPGTGFLLARTSEYAAFAWIVEYLCLTGWEPFALHIAPYNTGGAYDYNLLSLSRYIGFRYQSDQS